MMQGLDIIVKHMERVYRLRLLYGLHFTLYGLTLGLFAVGYVTPLDSLSHVLMLWLPVLLAHSAFQVYIELSEQLVQCILARQHELAYATCPAENLSRFDRPVELYDVDGNLISGGNSQIDFLPPPT